MLNTLGDLKATRNMQIEEGACEGSMYVGGNAHHGARFEKCQHRDECDLYKAYKEREHIYNIATHMRRLTPRVWRRCEPYKKGGEE